MNWLRRNRLILVFFLIVGALPIWKALIGGEAIGAFDQLAGMGWVNNASTPSTPWDVLQADSVLQFYVWRDLVFESWGRGQVAAWNPYELFGTPLLANSQSAVFYPPHILLGVLHIGTALGMALLGWFHLALAGLGVAFLARQLGASRFGASIGGAAFSVSAFMVAWTALPSVISTVAWIPWVLAFSVRSVRSPKLDFSSIGLAISVGMMILAGHLQFAAYGFIGLAGFLTMSLLVEKQWSRAWRVILAVVIGICLSAPQLLPTLAYGQFSHRRGTPSEEGYQAYVASAVQPFELVGLALPELNGNPQEIIGDPKEGGVSSYWPQFFKRGGNFAEGAIGVGMVVVIGLALMILALTRRKIRLERVLAIGTVGMVALLLAIGTPLNRMLYFGVPGWSATGSPGRISVLFVLAACVLGALGWSQFGIKNDESEPKWKPYLPVFAGAGVLALSFLAIQSLSLQTWLPGQKPEFAATVLALATPAARVAALVKFLIVAGCTALAVHFDSFRRHFVVAAIIGSALPGVGFGVRTSVVPKLSSALPNGYERHSILSGNWDLLQRPNAIFPPNLASLHRTHEAGGYDSLIHRETVKLLRDLDGEDPAPPANGNMMFIKKNADEGKLVAAGISAIWSKVPQDGWKDTGQGIFYKLIGGKRAQLTGGSAEIASETFGSLDVNVQGAGRLVVHDRNMPGWSVFVDGKQTELKGSTWLEADVPFGSRRVHFEYDPPGMKRGLILCLSALLSLSVLLLALLRRRAISP